MRRGLLELVVECGWDLDTYAGSHEPTRRGIPCIYQHTCGAVWGRWYFVPSVVKQRMERAKPTDGVECSQVEPSNRLSTWPSPSPSRTDRQSTRRPGRRVEKRRPMRRVAGTSSPSQFDIIQLGWLVLMQTAQAPRSSARRDVGRAELSSCQPCRPLGIGPPCPRCRDAGLLGVSSRCCKPSALDFKDWLGCAWQGRVRSRWAARKLP
ncbi:hypothetical protein BT67DRAFT_73746 [Trichocladium antarcticum]|uniref:Uncharacterized protein n=1 Tax=Trichocladium antarcticum TaxID=1450529 RepID=A0AAN6ZBC9_9PEZI|nr:hypothetical protein BT67DRAFT_73746 [Trichocladium antarcticum]